MSLIKTLPGKIAVYLNEDDHPPPHDHVYCSEGAFKLLLESGELLQTVWGSERKAAKQLKRTSAWIVANKEQLLARWSQRERGEKVEPL
jgi:hypothetical protein